MFFTFKLLIKLKKDVIIYEYNCIYAGVVRVGARLRERKEGILSEKNSNERAKKSKKQESALITKESISAVCALFSFLILLVLCTDSIIFGEIGRLMQDFFLGVFGYFAYPLLVAGIYLSIAVFLDKRFIKKRLAFCMASATFVTFLLILQVAFTYAWPIEGYAKACFLAGEKFTTATVFGWVGGCLLSALMSVIGKIGALIALSALCLLFVYATVISTGNRVTKRKVSVDKKQNKANVKVQPVNENTQLPTTAPVEPQTNYPPMQRESFSGSSYSYAPRPSVIINENDYYKNNAPQATTSGFSPFSGYKNPPQAEAVTASSQLPTDAEGRREFLLGSTPAEIYQKNLIFDSTASVNKRPPADPNQQSYLSKTVPPPVEQTGFSSYTKSYEESLNESKPVGECYNETSFTSRYHQETERSSYLNPEPSRVSAIPNEETPSRESENLYNERGYFSGREDSDYEERTTVLESDRTALSPQPEEEKPKETGYRRHDYMDYFSILNPNIFGRNENASDRNIEFGGRGTEREFPTLNTRETWAENLSSDRTQRESLTETSFNDRSQVETPTSDLFADRENSPYKLNTEESLFRDRAEGAKRDELERPQAEEERMDALNIFDDEQIEESVQTKEMEEPERRIGFGGNLAERNLQSVAFRREIPTTTERVVEEKVQETPVKKPRIYRPYVPAPLHYFDCSDVVPDADPVEIEEAKAEILNVYSRNGFTGIEVQSVVFGPTLTRYNLSFDISVVSSNKLITREIEASMSLALRVKNGVNMYLNYEERQICIEAPNKKRQTVQLGSMLTGSKYTDAKPGSLVFAIGKDIGNQKLYGDISEMVHMLVAGSTGSGKSVFLNTLIISLINRYSPEELRLILVDPKRTEFIVYNDLPHLMINEIINEPKKALQSLNWAIGEMNRRYELFAQMCKRGKLVRNLAEYNAAVTSQEEKLPKIVIIVDELADLMLSSFKKEVEERIQNITQKSRAAGIHMILATQRPSVNVVTGVIKANLATRFAFMVASDTDSRVILDESGAQKLLGYGDMLYGKVGNSPTRAQCAFISSEDCQRVVDFIRDNNEAYFDESATAYINNEGAHSNANSDDEEGDGGVEEVYIEALKIVILSNTASISMLQRKCSVGYPKAGKIIEWMEDMGYISPYDGARARKVLITKEEFEELYGEF